MPCFIGIDPNVLDAIAKSGTGVYQADTLEELAELIDVDPAAFTATVERYNEMCEKGVDEDFMKSPEYLIPVKNPRSTLSTRSGCSCALSPACTPTTSSRC